MRFPCPRPEAMGSTHFGAGGPTFCCENCIIEFILSSLLILSFTTNAVIMAVLIGCGRCHRCTEDRCLIWSIMCDFFVHAQKQWVRHMSVLVDPRFAANIVSLSFFFAKHNLPPLLSSLCYYSVAVGVTYAPLVGAQSQAACAISLSTAISNGFVAFRGWWTRALLR